MYDSKINDPKQYKLIQKKKVKFADQISSTEESDNANKKCYPKEKPVEQTKDPSDLDES